MHNENRSKAHRKNMALEEVFPEMERLLGKAEFEVLNSYDKPKQPIYLIVGCARSGTTLLYQYLAQTGLFTYPTNLISRFYYAPYVGARIQQLLLDFDTKGEIFNTSGEDTYKSELGKTFGPRAPHEFWYFWNRFFQFGEIQQLTTEEIKNVDWETFNKELAAFEAVYDKPLLMKAMNMNWNLEALAENIPNVHFIHLKRDTLYNAQSLLMARERFFGNREQWYSFKPPEYESIKNKTPEKQVVSQVQLTNEVITNQLNRLPKEQNIEISYEKFCNHPAQIIHFFGNDPFNDLETYIVRNKSFTPDNRKKINDQSVKKLRQCL